MKKLLCLLLAVTVLLLCGCGGSNAETQPTEGPTTAPTVATDPVTEPTTEPATEPTTVPTEPATEPTTIPTEPQVYVNPLNGEILDEPFTNRIFAVCINNLKASLPHVGVVDADIYMEMFVNGSVIRSIALYSDIAGVDTIGSARSTRLIFNDIAQRYDAYLAHAGGANPVLQDVKNRGLDNMNVDTNDSTSYSFRNMTRYEEGYGWEHCLFIKGRGLYEHVKEEGIPVSRKAGADYGLTFNYDATPENGEDASVININFTLNDGGKKTSTMEYDPDYGAYRYYQYDQLMVDGNTGELETYENVVVVLVKTHTEAGGYHVAEFTKSGSGEGYFACGGKIIPILWHCEDDNSPLTFTTVDGEPLDLNVGRTYIGICGLKSTVDYK